MSDLVRYPPGENSVEPPERKAATCPSCARPVADAEWEHRCGCDCAACLGVCFRGPWCTGNGVDWRARALAAELERDALLPVVKAAMEVPLACLEGRPPCSSEAEEAWREALRDLLAAVSKWSLYKVGVQRKEDRP